MVIAAAAVKAQYNDTDVYDDTERGKYSHGTSPKVCGSETADKRGLVGFNCNTGYSGQYCKVKCSRGVKSRNTPQKIYCNYGRWTDKKGKKAYDLDQFVCEESYNQYENSHNNYDNDGYGGDQQADCYGKKCKKKANKANKKANKEKKKNKKKNKYQSHNEAIEQDKYNGSSNQNQYNGQNNSGSNNSYNGGNNNGHGNNNNQNYNGNNKDQSKYNSGNNPYGCVGKHCDSQDKDDNKYKV